MNKKTQSQNKSEAKSSQPRTKNQEPRTHLASRDVVWTFTNKKELNKSQFIDYVERKVFRTIRKYQMLPKNKVITLKKNNSLNTTILKKIIETKFPVKLIPTTNNQQPTTNSDNLSQSAEDIFKNALKGNFHYSLLTTHCPLRLISDKELELYAKLTNINGTKRKQDKKIQTLFDKFLKKNQDLELNIVKASKQIND